MSCRMNATLCERCRATASILRKPRQKGRSISPKPSAVEGALQSGGPVQCRLTPMAAALVGLATESRTQGFDRPEMPWTGFSAAI